MAIRGVGGIHPRGVRKPRGERRWVGQWLLWIGHRWSNELLISSDGSSTTQIRVLHSIVGLVAAGFRGNFAGMTELNEIRYVIVEN